MNMKTIGAADSCPHCGSELKCLAGRSAHPTNWYCINNHCGYQAWDPAARLTFKTGAVPEGTDTFDYASLAEEDTTVRVSVVFFIRNKEGGTTPHAVEVKYKGKNALVEAMAKTRKLLEEEHGVAL
jgi:hypothetical protein